MSAWREWFASAWQKWKDFKFTRKHARYLAIALAAVAVVGVLGWLAIHFELLNKAVTWANDNQVAGAFIIGLCFIVICFPFALGYFLLGLTAGYIYDIWIGVLIMAVSTAIGSCLVYFICHTAWKARMERFLAGKPKLEMFMKAIKENGWKLVVLGRVTPIPIGIVNVIYGVSGINFKTFAIASVAGLLPEQFMITFLGTRMGSLSDIVSGDREMETPEKVTLVLELVLLVGLFIFVGYIGKRVMRRVEAEQAARQALELEGVTTTGGEGAGASEQDKDTLLEDGKKQAAVVLASEQSDKAGLLQNEETDEADDDGRENYDA